jgi:acyl-CoA reductase-like NAD-dependent aldehyde dehydrogenase
MIAAGVPREAFGFYPTDHGGAGELLRSVHRAMLFGDASTTRPWAKDSRIELHGPGFTKVILGEDAAGDFEKYLDVITSSIFANGGRSCINTSAVWTPKNARPIAEAIAKRLAKIEALPADHPEAKLAAFANPETPKRISASIDGAMGGGAEDLTEKFRGSGRLVTKGRCAYLLPTIVSCHREHPLANREFLFPYATVIECPQEEIPQSIGRTLVVSAITDDKKFQRALMACSDIQRLNLGPIPTWKLSWDQPHEGNLFELLYRQRAFQMEQAV